MDSDIENKQKLYDYLKSNKYMALATSTLDGTPEVATIEYVLEGDTILLNTFSKYRKYLNLTTNPKVAGVVTTKHDYTLQIDATVEELKGNEAQKAKELIVQAEESKQDYVNSTDARFFRMTPYWMRLRDYTSGVVKDYVFQTDKISN